MADHVTHPSLIERMERARKTFARKGIVKGNDPEVFEALTDVVTCMEDMKRTMDYFKVQLEDVRHGVGHLESTGTVPHTRRRG